MNKQLDVTLDLHFARSSGWFGPWTEVVASAPFLVRDVITNTSGDKFGQCDINVASGPVAAEEIEFQAWNPRPIPAGSRISIRGRALKPPYIRRVRVTLIGEPSNG